MSIGKRIKTKRQILGITQAELARGVGVTRQHVSAIEGGNVAPSLAILPKLAEELGVSIDYVVSGKEHITTDIAPGIVPAIKADKRLERDVKRALITLVEKLRGASYKEA